MKTFIVALGSFGDVNPFICVARELQRRGHDVVMLICEAAKAKVEQNGIATHVVLSQEQYDLWRNMPRLDDPDHENAKALIHMLLPAVTETITYIWKNFEPGNSLGITIALQGIGLKFLEQRLGLAVIEMHLAPRNWQSPKMAEKAAGGFDHHFAETLNEYASAVGVAKKQQGWFHTLTTDKYSIGLYPQWFLNASVDKASDYVAASHYVFDQDDDNRPLPEALIDFLNQDDAPLAVTFGTYATTDNNLYRSVIEASKRLNKRVVLITQYSEQLPEPLPKHCLHVDYVNLKLLFPRLCAIINHGGAGTCAQAFRAGIPQLICPMAFDQFINADSVTALGSGLQIKVDEFNPDQLQLSLNTLLNNEEIKNRATQLATSFPKHNPAIWSCDLIEKYAQLMGVLNHNDAKMNAKNNRLGK